MDIKNLIIALLAAALGVTTLEATGMIDLIADKNCPNSEINSDTIAPTKKLPYIPVDDAQKDIFKFVNEDTLKYPSSNGSHEKRLGVYFKKEELMQMFDEEETRIKNAGSPEKIDGFVFYPYRDADNRIDIYATTVWNDAIEPSIIKNPNYLRSNKKWCPILCGSIN
ncbi:MAG: hypothetical protein RIQ33_2535 [Bacteroidota bacterium]|jgi:hypothetical protein